MPCELPTRIIRVYIARMHVQSNYKATLSLMQKLVFTLISGLGILNSCSPPKPVEKRVALAKGNISFVSPDSSLAYSKPILYGPDYASNGDYGEAGAYYFSPDSTTRVSVYVRVIPTGMLAAAPWHVFANTEQQTKDLVAKNRGLAVIEHTAIDSLMHTIDIDYRTLKHREVGWRGQASCNKYFVAYGAYRRIDFYFTAPDTEANRRALALTRASLQINPAYLAARAQPYPKRQYQD